MSKKSSSSLSPVTVLVLAHCNGVFRRQPFVWSPRSQSPGEAARKPARQLQSGSLFSSQTANALRTAWTSHRRCGSVQMRIHSSADGAHVSCVTWPETPTTSLEMIAGSCSE